MDEDGKRMELEPGSALQETESQLANWYQQIDFSDVKLFIRNNIATASRSFIAIGYYLKYARDNQMYEEDGHASVWDFAMAEYGISKSTPQSDCSLPRKTDRSWSCTGWPWTC